MITILRYWFARFLDKRIIEIIAKFLTQLCELVWNVIYESISLLTVNFYRRSVVIHLLGPIKGIIVAFILEG